MESKDWRKRLRELSFMKGYYFKLADNGLVKREDDQLVFKREVLEHFIEQELDKAREEGKLEVLEELLEPMWDTPPEWKFMRLKTKMAHMMRDLLKLKDNK